MEYLRVILKLGPGAKMCQTLPYLLIILYIEAGNAFIQLLQAYINVEIAFNVSVMKNVRNVL